MTLFNRLLAGNRLMRIGKITMTACILIFLVSILCLFLLGPSTNSFNEQFYTLLGKLPNDNGGIALYIYYIFCECIKEGMYYVIPALTLYISIPFIAFGFIIYVIGKIIDIATNPFTKKVVQP